MAAKVLVVDDEPLVRWSIAETLGDRGYEVNEARDGASAMRSFLPPGAADVVLLDYYLPDSHGLQLLSALRAASPSTPVILMTAHGTPELSAGARRLGAFAVVDKPFEMSDLEPLVKRALVSG
jgi:two-component system response regulator AtoC